MTRTERPLLAWIVPVLLATLVITNGVLLALAQKEGALIGLVLYAILLWRWRGRDYQAVVVGALAGLAVHLVEVITMGWSTYPALMALNLVLPTALTPVAWAIVRRARQEKTTG
jgi:hypothetical protein